MTPTAPENAFWQELNGEQQEAVTYLEGPLLVLAGAGTGKTRVLTNRIAHILHERKARPHEILAVTFTNKAAHEMTSRVEHIMGGPVQGLWLGTFHSLCVRILRRHSDLIERTEQFTILDTDDQMRLIKQLLQAEQLDEKELSAKQVLLQIGRWKDRALLPDQVRLVGKSQPMEPMILNLYRQYQDRLKILNALDFGDLILTTIQLFQHHRSVLETYQNQFKYILVDEYQDTNVAQYLWLRLLAMQHNRLCCVGDDDQSIYGWRGAEVTNILRFEKDFPGARVIRLEQNYRSTPHILGAAAGLISHNKGRLGKTLWTEDDYGEKVVVRSVWNGEEEARYVGEEIESLQRQKFTLSQMAILVRATHQTREFEDRLMTLGIPYRVIGGARFYDRQEIRDAIAYLRVIYQPQDSLAFERIINVPKRGIGQAAMQTLHQYARDASISLYDAAQALVVTDELKGSVRKNLAQLLNDCERWRQQMTTILPDQLARIVLDESGYTHMWQVDKSADAPGRLENLKEFVNALRNFPTIPAFLEHVSLVMDIQTQALVSDDFITLMTLHSAKGLEFDVVFLPGWEEGIFPNNRSLDDGHLEEERRLAYVGITRARQRVFITHAMNRRLYGTWQTAIESRFILELPTEHVTFADGYRRTPSFQDAPFRGATQPNPSHQPKALKQATGFDVGCRVFHVKFGYGIIRYAQGDKVTVDFDHAGRKQVVTSFLQRPSDIV